MRFRHTPPSLNEIVHFNIFASGDKEPRDGDECIDFLDALQKNENSAASVQTLPLALGFPKQTSTDIGFAAQGITNLQKLEINLRLPIVHAALPQQAGMPPLRELCITNCDSVFEVVAVLRLQPQLQSLTLPCMPPPLRPPDLSNLIPDLRMLTFTTHPSSFDSSFFLSKRSVTYLKDLSEHWEETAIQLADGASSLRSLHFMDVRVLGRYVEAFPYLEALVWGRTNVSYFVHPSILSAQLVQVPHIAQASSSSGRYASSR